MERTTYAKTGITTLQGVYALLIVLTIVGLNVALVHALRTHTNQPSIMGGIWIVGVAIGTVRFLRKLALLDPRESGTQVAFELATLYPLVGIVPVMLLLL